MILKISNLKRFASQTGSTVARTIKKGFDPIGRTVTNIEGLEKFNKFVIAGVELTKFFYQHIPEPVLELTSHLKVFVEVVGACEIITRIREWIVPESPGVPGKEKPFWRNPGTSKTRILSKAILTVGKFLETLVVLDKYKLINLGAFAASVARVPIFFFVRFLPPLSVIKDVFILSSAALAVVDNSRKCRTAHAQISKNTLKLKKWKIKKELSEKLAKKADQVEQLQQSYFEVKRKGMSKKARMDPETEKQLQAEWKELLSKPLDEKRISKIDYKVEKWDITKRNNHTNQKRALISIAFDIGKIACISLSFAALAFAPAGAPLVGTLVTFGFITAALGYYRFYWESGQKGPIPLPKPPEAPAALLV